MLSVGRLGVERNEIRLQNTSRDFVELWLIEEYFPRVVAYSYTIKSQISAALGITPPIGHRENIQYCTLHTLGFDSRD